MDTRVSAQQLRAFMEHAYEKEGFEKEDAAQIADVLMQADLFGIESHGAQRMMYYHQNIKKGSINLHAKAEIIRETPVSALLDGHFADVWTRGDAGNQPAGVLHACRPVSVLV